MILVSASPPGEIHVFKTLRRTVVNAAFAEDRGQQRSLPTIVIGPGRLAHAQKRTEEDGDCTG